MSLALALLLTLSQTPPPLVSAEPPPPPKADPDLPLWQVTALATANVPTALEGSDFLLGLRGELDVWRIGALVTFDRTGTTPLTLADTRHWTSLLGYSVLHTPFLRVRALGGLSALTTDTTSSFAPALGATARLHWRFLGLEAAATFNPFGFRQLDARLEAILSGGLFELHVGYRVRLLDASAKGTLETLFASTPVAGPSIALGVSF